MSRMAITSLVDNAPPLSVLSLLNPLPVLPGESRKRPVNNTFPVNNNHCTNPRKRPKLLLSAALQHGNLLSSPEPPSPTVSTSSSSTTSSRDTSSHENNYYASRSPSSPGATYYKSEAERFAASRIIGQKHRDKEDASLDYLRRQVANLLKKNSALRKNCEQHITNNDSCTNAADLQARPNINTNTNTNICSSYKMSQRTAKILGECYWTGAVCLILLEIVAIRRNLVAFARDGNKRRRRNVLECPPDDTVFDRILLLYFTTAGSSSVPWTALLAAHERWAAFEQTLVAPVVTLGVAAEAKNVEWQNMDDEDMNEEERKRCSRCGKDKTAGSGHPRGHCDDGHEVCSEVPYGKEKNNALATLPINIRV